MAQARALVIDDNRALADTVAEILAERGFEVEVASSGVQALVRWREHPADLVVLDVDLPDIGGMTLARRLARRTAGCNLVVMSARDPQRLLPRCEELGAVFLAKPFSPAHLIAAIRLMLRPQATPRRSPPPSGHGQRRLLTARRPRALLQHSRPPRGSR